MIGNYVLIKDSKERMCYLNYKKLRGFRVKPRNRVVYDGVVVNKLLIIKTSFIEKLLKKKVKRKLDLYLKYIVEILDEDDDADSNLNNVLTDLKRYKSIVDNKYRIYLEEKYIELLLKKIELLEHELKTKMFIQSRVFQDQMFEKQKSFDEDVLEDELEEKTRRSR